MPRGYYKDTNIPIQKNKTHSKETRIKLSLSHIGIKQTEDTKKKISLFQKNKPHTEVSKETRLKISNTLKGNIPWNKGKTSSNETKNKLSMRSKNPKITLFGRIYTIRNIGRYPHIRINGRVKFLHVIVWEQFNGPKPKGYEIHHKDLNKQNYNLDNLELLSILEHKKIHKNIRKKVI